MIMTLNSRVGDKNVQDVPVSGVGVGRGRAAIRGTCTSRDIASISTKAVWIICVPTHKKNPWLFKTLKCAVLKDTERRAREMLERDMRIVPFC